MARFPFSAIVGQDEMKTALLLAAVEPRIGGVMVFGDRGTGKSTAARALAAQMPPIPVVAGCRYGCEPALPAACPDPCTSDKTTKQAVPFVDLPLGATEDRVIGALDLERALRSGEKVFEPGLLAKAHRPFPSHADLLVSSGRNPPRREEACASGFPRQLIERKFARLQTRWIVPVAGSSD